MRVPMNPDPSRFYGVRVTQSGVKYDEYLAEHDKRVAEHEALEENARNAKEQNESRFLPDDYA